MTAAAAGDAARWKHLARKHEGRARSNAAAAARVEAVEQQLRAANARLALSQVRARLAAAGIRGAAATVPVAMLDAAALLTDGEPDESKIATTVAALIAATTRVTLTNREA